MFLSTPTCTLPLSLSSHLSRVLWLWLWLCTPLFSYHCRAAQSPRQVVSAIHFVERPSQVLFHLVHSSLHLPLRSTPLTMPSMPWSKGHSQSNRSSTSLTLSPSSTSTNTRPTISAPLPPGRVPQGFPQAGRVSSGGVEQRLVPIERGAAELNNNNDASPSSASSASSYIPSSARKFLHRDRERQQGGPPSPQPDSSTFGVSRRSSLLGRSKPTPNPPQLHRQPDNDNRDLYLQQSPVLASHPPGSLSRPQSMLPSPLEAEIEITYSVDHNDTDSAQHYTHQKHHDGYQRPNTGTIEQQHGQQNYYDQGSQQYQQDHQQSQHQQQGNHMMPAPPHNPSRRSMDASHQSGPPGPPSREVSGLAGLQSYAAQQGGRGTDQQAYQTHGAGSGGGQPQPAYDPAKFEGQPTGRVMTPEQARVDSRASQAPEVINVGVLLQDHEILRTCILKLYSHRLANGSTRIQGRAT